MQNNSEKYFLIHRDQHVDLISSEAFYPNTEPIFVYATRFFAQLIVLILLFVYVEFRLKNTRH